MYSVGTRSPSGLTPTSSCPPSRAEQPSARQDRVSADTGDAGPRKDGEYESKPAVIRSIIDDNQDTQQLRQTVERLQREKRMILEQRNEHTELVKSIQRDQTLSEKKSRANIVTRWKWRVMGMLDE